MAKGTKKVEDQKEDIITTPTDENLINADEIAPIELPVTVEVLTPVPENVKPVTMACKAVPVSASGKVRLLDTRKNRIITGLIDVKRAQDQVQQFPHIQILNEADASKYEK